MNMMLKIKLHLIQKFYRHIKSIKDFRNQNSISNFKQKRFFMQFISRTNPGYYVSSLHKKEEKEKSNNNKK